MKTADATQKELFRVADEGFRHERIEFCDREKAFYETWKDDNDKRKNYYINNGQGILQDLFFDNGGIVHYIKPRERWIAATIIQWLGTNCGMSFLRKCLNKCGYDVVPIKKK